MSKTLVVVPTYNERDNITRLLDLIFSLNLPGLDVLVVDDNSPDHTADLVRQYQQKQPRVSLIVRPGKLGLGTAYITGFKYALENSYDYIIEMDADLSHDPRELPNFLNAIEECDVVIGSRYVRGVNVINWPLSRLILSVMANKYTRLVTGLPVHDSTSGFVCYRRRVLEAIPLDQVRSNGYSFQIEMKFKAWKRGFRLKEVPIIFVDREEGASKMNRRIMWEAALMVWKLKFRSWFKKY